MLNGSRDSRLDDPLSPTAEHWNSTRNRCLKDRQWLAIRRILSFGFQNRTGENFNCGASSREAWPRWLLTSGWMYWVLAGVWASTTGLGVRPLARWLLTSPADRTESLPVHRRVSTQQNTSTGPRLDHCSAGTSNPRISTEVTSPLFHVIRYHHPPPFSLYLKAVNIIGNHSK